MSDLFAMVDQVLSRACREYDVCMHLYVFACVHTHVCTALTAHLLGIFAQTQFGEKPQGPGIWAHDPEVNRAHSTHLGQPERGQAKLQSPTIMQPNHRGPCL